jgi:multidrug transporter EmrE-like cation transporter
MIFILIGITLMASTADVLLKVGASQAGEELANPLVLIQIPWIWLGAFLGIAAMALWVYVLSKHHISHAYPIFVGLTFLNISLAAGIYLGEDISIRRLSGTATVLVGIIMVHLYSKDITPPSTGRNSRNGKG